MKRRPAAVALLPTASGEGHIRTQARTPDRSRRSPSVEIAGSKPADPSDPRTMIRFGPEGLFEATGVTLKLLLRVKYKVHDSQILGLPPRAKPADAKTVNRQAKAAENAGAPIADAPSRLVTAIAEQPGLKLEPRKAPVKILLIDHAEKVPSEN